MSKLFNGTKILAKLFTAKDINVNIEQLLINNQNPTLAQKESVAKKVFELDRTVHQINDLKKQS